MGGCGYRCGCSNRILTYLYRTAHHRSFKCISLGRSDRGIFFAIIFINVLQINKRCVYLHTLNNETMVNFTADQQQIIAELAKYIQFKGLSITCKADLDAAFKGFMTSNFSYNYFHNEDFSSNVVANIKSQLIQD